MSHAKYFDTAEDIDWLFSTHLKAYPGISNVHAVVHGNEDSPERVELFAPDSGYRDKPIAVFVQNDAGNLVKE